MSRFTVVLAASEVLVQTLRLGYVLARRFISRIARAVERCSATETRCAAALSWKTKAFVSSGCAALMYVFR